MENKGVKNFIINILGYLTNRVTVLIVLFVVAFYILIANLFNLQIVNGSMYLNQAKPKVTKTIFVEAQRGEIYDRYGRPLAINESTYTVKIDPSVKPENATEVFVNLVKLFEKNGEILQDLFPISVERPYSFTYTTEQRQIWWKENMNIPVELDAEASIQYLKEFFKLSEGLTQKQERDALSLLSAAYMERFNLNHFTAAVNVSQPTVTTLEEYNQDFPGVYISLGYLRLYPEKDLFSHMLGYLGRINADELETYNSMGYTGDDIIGKTGIEKAFELQLRGTSGELVAEIGQNGRRVATLEETSPVSGDNVILSVDRDMQEKSYEIIYSYLKEILINKMSNKSTLEKGYTDKELVNSMLEAQNLSVKKIMDSMETDLSYPVRQYVENNIGTDVDSADYLSSATSAITEAVSGGKLSVSSLVLAMYEQGIITLTETELNQLIKNKENTQQLLIRKIEEDEITPQLANLQPSSASAVLVDVKTGEVITAVCYPSYDNNELVNNFNNEYYQKLINDPTTPMVNRPFTEPRPPGSTFKMITGLAGLEEGVITSNTTIFDKGVFKEAGIPYANCRTSHGVGGYHGSVNIIDALKVSCNYYFYETAYRLGNTAQGTKIEGIGKLNEMMDNFGLNDRTGVEIGELYDSYPADLTKLSSPEFKDYVVTMYNPNADKNDKNWVDGDTVRTAIGQSFNNYTCAMMAKYIATLATRGARYSLHLMNSIVASNGSTVTVSQPKLEKMLDLKSENIDVILEGMKTVTTVPGGTGYSTFKDFPITVGGKTGTAQQEADYDHTEFGGFAPYDDPQVAIFVVIPYGDTRTLSAPAAHVARDILAEYFGLNSEPELTTLTNDLVK